MLIATSRSPCLYLRLPHRERALLKFAKRYFKNQKRIFSPSTGADFLIGDTPAAFRIFVLAFFAYLCYTSLAKQNFIFFDEVYVFFHSKNTYALFCIYFVVLREILFGDNLGLCVFGA